MLTHLRGIESLGHSLTQIFAAELLTVLPLSTGLCGSTCRFPLRKACWQVGHVATGLGTEEISDSLSRAWSAQEAPQRTSAEDLARCHLSALVC